MAYSENMKKGELKRSREVIEDSLS